MKKLLLTALLAMPMLSMAQLKVKLATDESTMPMSQMMYGIFYEDINHAADGGIYAELIRNRSFEDSDEEAESWVTFGEGATITLTTKDLLNEQQGQALHVTSNSAEGSLAGIATTGFWGINCVKGQKYRLSFWVKTKNVKTMQAMLMSKDGSKTYGSACLTLEPKQKGWQKVTATLTSNDNDAYGKFVLATTGKADYLVDMVSLFPPTYKNRENGLRPDLVEMLRGLKPRFMRFPGGCFVEGQDTPDNAFRWERTIGPIEQRPGHWNKNWGYRTSDGLGFHEYLQLSEDLNAIPLYVCNIGIWHGGVTPLDSLDLWINECLGAIEYANGDVSTHYGRMRAENGHPAPFNLQYIEVGNENNQKDGQQTSDRYYERFVLFRDAILKHYPEMHIVGDVAAWGTDDPRWESGESVELVDEHYYRSPSWFASNFHKYDSYDRSWPKVYCGEYAVTNGFGDLGNLDAALGEAVFMMGMENNSDIVTMSSYAPIFVNENDDRWRPDMIRFSSSRVMGTPSYYVQKLMAENLGTRVVPVVEGSDYELLNLDKIMTPEMSSVGLATWNTKASFRNLRITDADGMVYDIDCTSSSAFTPFTQGWKATPSGISQTEIAERCLAFANQQVKGTKYSVEVDARKDDGSEGFILVFNGTGKSDFVWFNIGGWSNSQHGIEVYSGGSSLIASKIGSIETGKWYHLRAEIDDNNITTYLDGEKVMEAQLRDTSLNAIYTSASIDDNTNELIVKIVNTSGATETLNLDLGIGGEEHEATLIQMRAESKMAENTLFEPTNVYPTTKNIVLSGACPDFKVQPYSLNILRIKR